METWGIFAIVFAAVLAFDLFWVRGEVTPKQSLILCSLYAIIAVNFGILTQFDNIGQYLTIYMLETVLSVDNLLVISLIFAYFGIPKAQQHKALLFGIAGVIVFRALFISGGAALLDSFHWLVYLFAAFLIYTGVQIMRGDDGEFDPDKKWLVRVIKNRFGAAGAFWGAILAVELCDVMFALDSIPASLSISTDMFTVFTANMFAVIGLRAMYHAVAHGLTVLAGIERYVGAALVVLGGLVVAEAFVHVPEAMSIVTTVSILGLGVATLLRNKWAGLS